MLNMKRAASGLALALLLVGGCALALLSRGSATTANAAAEEPAGIEAASAYGVFREQDTSPTLPGEQAQLRAMVVNPEDAALPLGRGDYSLARPVDVPEQGTRAWVLPSGERVCTVIVRAGAWGAGCVTAGQVDAGEGQTVLAKRSGDAVLVDFVADGAPGPVVDEAQGAQRELAVAGNTAVAVVPVSDSVASPQGLMPLAP
jgi:hypothetical protein